MRSQVWKRWQNASLYLKCGFILFFLFLSVLIVACGSSSTNGTDNTDLTNPAVTVTLRIGQFNGTPTPPLPPYNCGAWATDTSPSYYSTSAINVYAKFTQNVNGNPVGVDNASGTATIEWPDGSFNVESASTTSDGLAVFPVAIKPVAINKIVLVNVTFTKPGVPSCTVPQAAYFTAVVGTPGSDTSPTAISGGGPTSSPTTASTPGQTPVPPGYTPIPSPTPNPTKTPKPTKTPAH